MSLKNKKTRKKKMKNLKKMKITMTMKIVIRIVMKIVIRKIIIKKIEIMIQKMEKNEKIIKIKMNCHHDDLMIH